MARNACHTRVVKEVVRLNNKQIQINLNFLGFNCGKVDGKIGLKTRSAIKSFQKSFELTRTGKWNSETDTKCIQVVKDIQRSIGAIQDGIVGRRNY